MFKNTKKLYLFIFIVLLLVETISAKTIPKSPNDDREYRFIILPNQLQVLLISDKKADKAAAAMGIAAGQWSDPDYRPGLAHFCEHMLFLGTKKYPDSKEYSRYLSNHGGSFNAFTSLEDTNYHFSVNYQYLEGALDRFSQFFIAPLFSKEFVQREMNAVDSEFRKNIPQDSWRAGEVVKATANQKHPFTRFGIGSLKTLRGKGLNSKKDIYQDLLEFYETHYSANQMKLAILGRESLNDLEKLVRKYFSQVKNRDLKGIQDQGQIFTKENLAKRIEILPIKNVRQLSLIFPIEDTISYYKSTPTGYLASLIGDERKGSIISILKKKGWVNSLSAGSGRTGTGNGRFSVNMSLTRAGIKKQDEIIETVFRYINLIKKTPLRREYFEEFKKLRSVAFKFKPESAPLNYVKGMVMKMRHFPAEELNTAGYFLTDYRPDLIKGILAKLTPENMRIMFSAKGIKTDRVEKWFGSRYSVKDISPKLLKRWKNSQPLPAMKLPEFNPFITDNVQVKKVEKEQSIPDLVKNTEKSKVWFKQDNKFDSPRALWGFTFTSPNVRENIKNSLMNNLFIALLNDKLIEENYSAMVAGLNSSVGGSFAGFSIRASGYSEKLPLLLEKLAKDIIRTKFKPERLEIIKERKKRGWQNFKYNQSYKQARYYLAQILSPESYYIDDFLKTIDQISLKDIENYRKLLLSELRMEGLVTGNITKKEVLTTSALIEKILIKKPFPLNEAPVRISTKLPAGKTFVYQTKVEERNSSIILYYQAGKYNLNQSAKLALISMMIRKPFYHQLRTIEQLGYIVQTSNYSNLLSGGIAFIIQSPVKDPVYLAGRIESFIQTFEKELENYPQDKFEEIRQTLITLKLQEPKTMASQSGLFQGLIKADNFSFDLREQDVAELKKVTKKDLVTFYREIFLNPNKIKRINVQAFGQKHPLRKALKTEIEIRNIKKFKTNADTYKRNHLEAYYKAKLQ